MRTLLLSAVAALAIAAPAAAETTGSVGVSYTNNDYSGFDYQEWDLEGSIFHRIAGPWAIQGEAGLETVDYPSGDDDGNRFAVHGLYSTDTFTVGILAGQGEIFGDLDVDFYGVEGAFNVGDWRFTGSAIQGDAGGDLDRYRVAGKYYFGDNFAVGLGYAGVDYGTTDWDTWDIGATYRFGAYPIALTGGYLSQDGQFIDVDAWTIGARWEFGTANLRESDRTAPIADVTNYFGDLRRWD